MSKLSVLLGEVRDFKRSAIDNAKFRLRETFINEDALNEDKGTNILKTILKKDYKQFVASLGKHIKDPKFIAAIETLSDKAPVKTSAIAPVCTDLRPTQNEVVMDKSLSYPLTDVPSAEQYLKGGVVAVAGKSIITSGGGKYVIDGHHRWSQVLCINPEAKIKALDLTDIKEPIEALKATQLGIAAQTGDVPKASGGGVNLFTVSQDELKKYVIDKIKEPVVAVFEKYGKGDTPEAIADYIWENVKVLKSTSKPVTGAPKRDVMPQTDDAPQWVDNTFNVEKLPEELTNRFKELLRYNNRDK
jgi:hypothetical protein